MPTAYATNEFVFDFTWADPDTNLTWLYRKDCWDYQDYRALPAVVRYSGSRFIKSGWNSDTGSVAYRQVTPSDIVAVRE
jgi:hypothetical protein